MQKVFGESVHELSTEVLQEKLWLDTIKIIVEYMKMRGFEQIETEFGGLKNPEVKLPSHQLDIEELESLIVYKVTSDLVFYTYESRLLAMLCQDGEIRFASKDPSMVTDLGQWIKALGVKVYSDGVLIK